MALKSNTEEFIEKARKVHGEKYDYSKIDYIDNKTKVCIICPKHGEFWQIPTNHLHGSNCPKCTNKIRQKNRIKTKEVFIKQAKQIHGDKYIYTQLVYKSAKDKVCITCPIHGNFLQNPSDHLHGYGCPKCAINRRILTKKDFVTKANKVHKGKYTYENAVLENTKIPILITCPIHGGFYQTPHTHLSGSGCPECGKEKSIQKRHFTKDDFIAKAKKVHGDKYIYDNVVYVNSQTPLWITCPEHGDFLQTPNTHLQGHGCPECGKIKKNLNLKEFIAKANKIHNGKYTYDNVNYKNCYTPISITCPIHGVFNQKPAIHLQGSGCPKCYKLNKSLNTENFIEKAVKVHNGKYTYDKAKYADYKTPLLITCPIHGDFLQRPDTHLKGSGCPKCAKECHLSENHLFEFLTTFIHTNHIKREYKNKKVLNRLHLDFYIPMYKIGIEYQGGQHFYPVKKFGGKNSFKKVCERDKRKFQKCNEHGIKLFYFTYEAKDVPENYFTEVYTNEEELKRNVLAYIQEQSHQQSQENQTFARITNLACFKPDDIDPS